LLSSFLLFSFLFFLSFFFFPFFSFLLFSFSSFLLFFFSFFSSFFLKVVKKSCKVTKQFRKKRKRKKMTMLTPMIHRHWTIQGNPSVEILSIPDESTIENETEDFIIHIINNGNVSTNSQSNQVEERYYCELRGGEDIRVYKQLDGNSKIARMLVNEGRLDQKFKRIIFNNNNAEVWIPTSDPAAGAPTNDGPSSSNSSNNSNCQPCAPCLPCAPCAPCASCPPCPTLSDLLVSSSSSSLPNLLQTSLSKLPSCKPVPCRPCPPCQPCKICPPEKKQNNTWMYVAIILMSLLGIILFRTIYSYIKKKLNKHCTDHSLHIVLKKKEKFLFLFIYHEEEC
jgi:ABC-type multidrug transport system fused ATPase/permease subunit